ncbi:unnamed protein product [Blumeria hordei]|uniref:Mevalonate kinase n=1 Tax=Blumeria hordei TaxID=2867405 RepID=A0A383UY35_BLUHO|nr:unnamed protein product [Blumeria hordei]
MISDEAFKINVPSDENILTRKMTSFVISAPGKVIAFGEHAVVYGKTAVAVSISLRSYLLVTSLLESPRRVSIRFPDIGLSHTWNIDDLPWASFSPPGSKINKYLPVTSFDPALLTALEPHLRDISTQCPDGVRKIHRNSALAFLYLLLSLGSSNFQSCSYIIRSTIPIGAGLGSSASISVCIATALLLQTRAITGPNKNQSSSEARIQLDLINKWAFVGEICIHGNPSGVDNTVASYGKAVIFQRSDQSKKPSIESKWNFPELPLLLVDTREPKSTAVEVAKVADLKRQYPELAESIFSSIDTVSKHASNLLSANSFDGKDLQSVSKLGKLIQVNHGLLVALGVSHPRLERIREIVDHEGIGWTKLTGAGGGGCAIVLLKPDLSPKKMELLDATLEGENFSRYKTVVGGKGVGVLWPASFENRKEVERGDLEIYEEKFLNAEKLKGVEKLVGVHGLGGTREAWKFWQLENVKSN